MPVPTILQKITQKKHEEVKEKRALLSLTEARAQAMDCAPTRGFAKKLIEQVHSGEIAIIAEIKKASPSKGIIRQSFDPSSIAISYEKAGATCLSVLTDQPFFQGHSDYLKQARAATYLPVLRKDFIIDPWQLYEARIMGADCVLLIVSALSDTELADFNGIAQELNISVLIEVHGEDELERVLPLKNTLLGINNRNLNTFEVSLHHTLSLLSQVPSGRVVITESGIHTRADIETLLEKKVNAFLIGEAFMRQPDPGIALLEMLSS